MKKPLVSVIVVNYNGKMTKIKGVLLDLDNTLYDYDLCNDCALKKVFSLVSKKFNISIRKVKKSFFNSRKEVKKYLNGTAASHSRLLYFKKMLENLNNFTDSELSLELEKVFWDEYFKFMCLKKEALDFLRFCQKNSIKIAIITDLTTQIQLRKTIHLGISKYINYVITSEDVGKEKPHSLIFKVGMKKIKCNPKDIIMIGDDMEKDINPATKLGIKSYTSFLDIDLKIFNIKKS